MRVTNSMIFDRITYQLNQQQARLAETQEKISTGRAILKPSDAPDQVAALDRLESNVRQTERFILNIGTIKDKLSQQELAITTINDDLIRVKEIVLQGANGSMSANGRKALAVELREIYNGLVTVSNRKDVDGSYLFSGYVQERAPYDQDGTYYGNDEIQKISVDQGYELEVGMPGSRVFAGFELDRVDDDGDPIKVKSDIFTLLSDAVDALENNDVDGLVLAIDDTEVALEHVNVRLAQVGSKMRTAENLLDIHTSRADAYEQAISRIADLDYASAVTELKNQSLALQAGQASFAQISNLSLFNYIR